MNREDRIAYRTRDIEERLFGRGMKGLGRFDERLHPRTHGKFMRKFGAKKEHPITSADSTARYFYANTPGGAHKTHEDLLRGYFGSNDRSVFGSEHDTVTKSLHAIGAHDLAQEMDKEREASDAGSYVGYAKPYNYSREFEAKVRSRVGLKGGTAWGSKPDAPDYASAVQREAEGFMSDYRARSERAVAAGRRSAARSEAELDRIHELRTGEKRKRGSGA